MKTSNYFLQRRQENSVSQGTFLLTIYADIMILANEFGYHDSHTIVDSLFNLKKNSAIDDFYCLLCSSCMQK